MLKYKWVGHVARLRDLKWNEKSKSLGIKPHMTNENISQKVKRIDD